MRALTLAQLRQSFALIYSNIYGSQIGLLEKLNSMPLAGEQLSEWFAAVQNGEKAFTNTTLDDYLRFLLSWELITQKGDQIEITLTGSNFLQFIVVTRLSKDRLY